MIFISLGDIQGQANSSAMSEILAGKSQCYFACPCNFLHDSAEANYFFLRSVAPLCEKIIFACGRSYVTFAMRKSMLDMPIPGSF